jgi:hypothetical protein
VDHGATSFDECRAMTRRIALAAALLAAGCASVLGIPDDVVRGSGAQGDDGGDNNEGGTHDGPGGDDGPGSDGGHDANGDAPIVPTCDPKKDFTAPVVLAGISTGANEGSARFTDDELTIWFDTDRGDGGPFDLYTATRATTGSAFGPATPIPGVNTALQDFAPSVTSDELTIVYEQQDKTGVSRLYSATRAAPNGTFGNITALTTINSNDYTANPFLRGNGSELWYVNETAPLLGIDIWRATLQAGKYVGAKVPVVSTNAEELAPVISADGLTLYYGSDATVAGFAGINVWVAKRASTAVDFATPSPLTSVSSASDEQPTWVSPDGCRLYLSSNRPGGAGKQDVWVASRPF